MIYEVNDFTGPAKVQVRTDHVRKWTCREGREVSDRRDYQARICGTASGGSAAWVNGHGGERKTHWNTSKSPYHVK